MAKFIGKKLISVIITLFILSIVIFTITHGMGGDPVASILGTEATAEDMAAMREQLGLNDPISTQYIRWVTSALRGDLGDSYVKDQTVVQAISERVLPSLQVAIFSQIIAMIIGIPLGIIAAKKKGSLTDLFCNSFSLLGISMPSFLLGLLFILLFGVQLKVLPVSGYALVAKRGLYQHIRYLILPCVTMGLIHSGLIMRTTRSAFLDILNKDYIKTAKAKGLKQSVVLYKHVMRNAATNIVTVIGQGFGQLIAGTAVLETMFNIPGMGQLIVDSVLKRDYGVIQGAILLISVFYVLVNLLVDISYGFLDPRIRTGK